MGRKKTEHDYYKLAEKRGFEWLSEGLPKNTHTKTFWGCLKGHKWEICYHAIQQGNGCPYCAGKARKVAKDYHALAKKRGFKWLGKKCPQNIDTKTLWQCKKDHGWEARYDNIRQGTGCPHCYGNMPKTAEDYHKLAKVRGFKWEGQEVIGIHEKTWWKCSKGHRWEAPYGRIRQEHGCPYCVDIINGQRVSKPQRQLCEMMGGELNYPCGPYRIDIALPDKMIAIEYDCWYWHGNKLEEDAERDTFLFSRGWKVLHIKTSTGMPFQWELDGAIAKLENGEKMVEIVLDDWGKGPTFAKARTRVPINKIGNGFFSECVQLHLWQAVR